MKNQFTLIGIECKKLNVTKPHQFLHVNQEQFNHLIHRNLDRLITAWAFIDGRWVNYNDVNEEAAEPIKNWLKDSNLDFGYVILIHNQTSRHLGMKYRVKVVSVTGFGQDKKFPNYGLEYARLQAIETTEMN